MTVQKDYRWVGVGFGVSVGLSWTNQQSHKSTTTPTNITTIWLTSCKSIYRSSRKQNLISCCYFASQRGKRTRSCPFRAPREGPACIRPGRGVPPGLSRSCMPFLYAAPALDLDFSGSSRVSMVRSLLIRTTTAPFPRLADQSVGRRTTGLVASLSSIGNNLLPWRGPGSTAGSPCRLSVRTLASRETQFHQ